MGRKLQPKGSGTIVCWSKCAPPKRKSGTQNSGTATNGQDDDYPCTQTMAQRHYHQSVAVCSPHGKRHAQRYSQPQMERWANSLIKISPFASFSQSQTLAALWVSRVRSGKKLADSRRNSPQMERESKGWHLPRSITAACAISGSGPQPSHRARIPSVPRIVRHYFPDNEVQLWWATSSFVMAGEGRF